MVENLRLSAHRGAHTVAPENTLEAYQAAINLGYGAIELDPRFSSDGEIFIMHDDTVDRTTNGTGSIAKMTSSEIKNLEIDISNYPKYSGKVLRVPTFEEAVKVIANGNVILNVDGSKVDWSNTTFTSKIVNILKRYGVFEKTYFVITNKNQRDLFVSSNPTACVSWLHTNSTTIASAISESQNYKRSMISIPISVANDSTLTILRNSNVYFQVYYVNNQMEFERLKSRRVPMIETDSLIP